MKKMNKASVLAIGAAVMMSIASTPYTALASVDYSTGKVTINYTEANSDNKQNTNVTYNGYQIFKANVEDASEDADDDSDEAKTGKVETNIAWVNDAVKSAVEALIRKDDSSYAGKTAQDAAEYISSKINTDTASDVAAGNGTRHDNDSFADKLAEAVKGKTTAVEVKPGVSATLDEGYWLFVTAASADDAKDETGTAPVFAVIGGSDVTITEKTSIPTVEKKIQNDKTGDELHKGAADSQMEQEINYELTGTVSDNVKTFETYTYRFTDKLPESMTANTDSIKVYIDNGGEKTLLSEVASGNATGSGYSVTYEDDNILLIDFANLLNVQDANGTVVSIDKDSKVVVDYTAKFDSSKADKLVVGGSGNQNETTITYSNNPYETTSKGTSTKKTATDYAYQLVLKKIDRSSEVNLPGAKFTIQATAPDDTDSKDKYVQADGSLGDTAYEFTTDDDGTFTVKGLDAGTYTVVETTAPDGYKKTDSFTFEIIPTFTDGSEELTNLDLHLTATDSVIAGGTDSNVTDNVLTAASVEQIKDDSSLAPVDKETGTVRVTVGDVKKIHMPLTGKKGIMTMVVIGGSLVVLGLYVRKKDEKSGQPAR